MNKRPLFRVAWFFLITIQTTGVFAMSMKEVVEQIGQHANMMPIESGFTLPMVQLEDNRIIVRRLIYFTRTTPDMGTVITPPQYVGSYDYTNQRFITMKQLEIELTNLQPPPWIHNRPHFDNPDEIIPEYERIWTLYDILIPEFIKGQSHGSDEIKQAAKLYTGYFERHAEKPLRPYYELYSGNFLHWLRQIAND